MRTRAILMLMTAGCFVGSAIADLVIGDKDFESQTVMWTKVYAAYDAGTTDWDSNDTSAQYRTDNYPPVRVSGTDSLLLNGGGIFQNFTDSYVAGNTYSVSFWAYKDWGSAPTVWAYFTDGSGTGDQGGVAKLSTKTGTLIEDQWVEFTVSYTATVADAGDHVGFGMAGTTGLYVDDMSDITVIPEPATFGLFGIIGASMLAIRRKLMI